MPCSSASGLLQREHGAPNHPIAREHGGHGTIQWFGRCISPGGTGIFIVPRQRRDESTVFDWILFPGILLCAVRIHIRPNLEGCWIGTWYRELVTEAARKKCQAMTSPGFASVVK
jgi:hypothetical protein